MPMYRSTVKTAVFYRINNGRLAKTTLRMTWQRGILKAVNEILKNADAINLFSANESILIIESENELIECDLDLIVSKTQKLLHTEKPD